MKELLHDETRDGVRFIVVQGPVCLCGYVGIPLDHPLAGKHYDDIDLPCHGGMTFSGEGTGEYLPKGFYWYGWDYGHAGNFMNLPGGIGDRLGGRRWTVEEVVEDSREAISAFIQLVKEV